MLHSGKSNAGVRVVKEENKSLSDTRVISSLTIAHIAQHVFSGAPILYQSIRDELGLNYTQIGVMAATTSILGGFGQMAYSIAGRKVPRRLLLTLSNLFMSIGAFFMGISFRFETLILGNATAGVGTAGMHPVSSSIISQKWEKKKIGLALSLFYGLGFAGNIIGPLLLSTIALKAGGWRVSYYFLAVVLLCCGSIGFFWLRGEPAAERSISKQSDRRLVDDIKSALKVKEATLILLVQVFISGGSGLGVMNTWVPLFLRDPTKGLGLDVWTAGLVSSIATSGGVLGTILLGRIADKKGYLRTAIASLTVTITMIFLLLFENSFSLLVIPHFFILSMTTFSMSSLLQAHLAGVSTTSERDILLGLYFTLGQGVSSLWSTLLGSLVDQYSFNAIWITMVSAGVSAMVCLIIAYRAFIEKQSKTRI